jgi:hypothetical protein
MVNLGPPHQLVTHTGASVWERAWFSGLHERAILIESHLGTHLVSARLHPLGALRLLGPPIARLANTVVDLEALLGPPAGELRALLLAGTSAEQRFAQLEQFLLRRISSDVVPSPMVLRGRAPYRGRPWESPDCFDPRRPERQPEAALAPLYPRAGSLP